MTSQIMTIDQNEALWLTLHACIVRLTRVSSIRVLAILFVRRWSFTSVEFYVGRETRLWSFTSVEKHVVGETRL